MPYGHKVKAPANFSFSNVCLIVYQLNDPRADLVSDFETRYQECPRGHVRTTLDGTQESDLNYKCHTLCTPSGL